jgi:hypothetical protein
MCRNGDSGTIDENDAGGCRSRLRAKGAMAPVHGNSGTQRLPRWVACRRGRHHRSMVSIARSKAPGLGSEARLFSRPFRASSAGSTPSSQGVALGSDLAALQAARRPMRRSATPQSPERATWQSPGQRPGSTDQRSPQSSALKGRKGSAALQAAHLRAGLSGRHRPQPWRGATFPPPCHGVRRMKTIERLWRGRQRSINSIQPASAGASWPLA